MSSNRQTPQMPELLQVFRGRGCSVGAYPEAQGVEACQDSHLCLLRQELHAGERTLCRRRQGIPEIIFSFNYLQINSQNLAKT